MVPPLKKTSLDLGSCTGDGYQIILKYLQEKLTSTTEPLSVKHTINEDAYPFESSNNSHCVGHLLRQPHWRRTLNL